MAENKNIFQRLFSTFGFASGSRIPIRSNVYGFNGGGHSGIKLVLRQPEFSGLTENQLSLEITPPQVQFQAG